jgi:hypothetical protein
MKSISQQIEEARVKHKIPDTSGVPAPAMTEPEKNWQKCKEFISALPGNYAMLFQEALEKKLQMKSIKMGKYTINTIINWKFGYETQLEIVENENGAVQKVTYYAFNGFTNTAYIRKVLGGNE